MKKSIVMLVANDPTHDPRIDWEASYAGQDFDVEIIGFQPPETKKPKETTAHYQILRKERLRSEDELAFFALHFYRMLSKKTKFLVIPVIVLCYPLTVICELLFKTFIWLLRLFKRFFKWISPKRINLITIKTGRIASRYFLARLFKGLLQTKANWKRELGNFKWLTLHYFLPIIRVLSPELMGRDKKPDVIHCNDLDTLFVGILLKQEFGCKVVYDAHEYWAYSDPRASFFHVKFFSWYEKFLIRKADAVITVNHLLAEKMRKDYGLKKVYAIPNVAPWEDNKSTVTTVTRVGYKMLTLAGDRLKFLFQGGFAPERGVEELIKLWGKLDTSRAALFLRGPKNQFRDQCETLARDLGLLNKSVYFLEAVKEEELIFAASYADVGIIPYKPVIVNHIYSCPNKLSQYMQAGLAIITNNLLFVKQIVEQAQCGLVYDSHSEENMRTVFMKMINERENLLAYKNNGREYTRTTYNWQNYYGLLKKIYEKPSSEIIDTTIDFGSRVVNEA